MPPLNPPLKNDGPACRVCGCTEHNACLVPIGLVHDAGCSWVKTEARSAPLCSACSGTLDDAVEVVRRVARLMGDGYVMRARAAAKAFIERHEAKKRVASSS